MTSSQAEYRERIGKNEALPKRLRSYYQQRFQQQVFARIAKAFAERAETLDIKKSTIAALLDKDPGQVNRLLSHPTNLTLDTLSDIALALNFEPNVVLEDLEIDPRHNYCHPSYEFTTKLVKSKVASPSSKATNSFRILDKVV